MPKKKTGPLTKAEVFYIDSHVAKKTPKEIADDLRRNEATITKHIKTLAPIPVEEEEPEKEEEEYKPLRAGDHIKLVTESGDENRGVAVMTKTAAELGDAQRKRFSKKKDISKQKGVHVINPDKPCK